MRTIQVAKAVVPRRRYCRAEAMGASIPNRVDEPREQQRTEKAVHDPGRLSLSLKEPGEQKGKRHVLYKVGVSPDAPLEPVVAAVSVMQLELSSACDDPSCEGGKDERQERW